MGLKRLSRSILFSLAVFAGVAELRAHVAPLGEVSPDLTVVQKQASLQQKKNAPGFGAYLRQSAKSLGASFVAAVKVNRSDRALALKKAKRVLGAHHSAPKTPVLAQAVNSHGQQTALSAIHYHEDLSRTVCITAPCRGSAVVTSLHAAKQLWNSLAKPPNVGRPAMSDEYPTTAAPMGEASVANHAAKGAAPTGKYTQSLGGGLRAGSLAADIPGSARALCSSTVPAQRPEIRVRIPRSLPGDACKNAPADSKGLNPHTNRLVFTLEAVSGQILPSLG